MRAKKVWACLVGVEGLVVVDDVTMEGDGIESALIVSVRPKRREQQRCPECRELCPRYDEGDGRRRWRAPDLGLVRAFVEADAPRVTCAVHGVIVAAVPWARHAAGFTRAFEDQAAWLTTHTDRTTVSDLLRIAWRSVGSIIERVSKERGKLFDRLANLRRIGIDEVSYRKGHRYLTVVVDHDSGRLVWASPGHDEETLERFFAELGPQRCGDIRLVSADAAGWISAVVTRRCPGARLCLDPFHVVKWATQALDKVRRLVWGDLRRTGQMALAMALKGARWALRKNPENLTEKQSAKLATIQRANRPLYRAYLLKEQLREVFKTGGWPAVLMLDEWLAWASRSRLTPFVELARSIRRHRDDIYASLVQGLSNARIEAANTKLRLLTRLAYGFHGTQALIAIAMLKLGGLCPPLPGRN